jgi:hypothetical protein
MSKSPKARNRGRETRAEYRVGRKNLSFTDEEPLLTGASSQGFWSYVRRDDEAEGGRIAQLARDVAAQFEMISGDPLELFLDRDAIKWGEDWQAQIDANLVSVAFFIPVLTPRYFLSPACRRELQFFARKASDLGLKDLILPLVYVDVDALSQDSPTDDLISLVKTFQWEDWRDLRFTDPASEAYRRGVARLAVRLVDANRHAEVTSQDRTETVAKETSDDDDAGFIDLVASSEEALPKLVETLDQLRKEIEFVGKTMQESTAEVQGSDKAGLGFGARRALLQKLAGRLSPCVERIFLLGNDYTSHLHEVDRGFRVIIERAPAEIRDQPESKVALCVFFGAVEGMSRAAHEGLQQTQVMVEATKKIEGISRDLRPILRRLREGLTTMVEARSITDEWAQLIAHSGVACDDMVRA